MEFETSPRAPFSTFHHEHHYYLYTPIIIDNFQGTVISNTTFLVFFFVFQVASLLGVSLRKPFLAACHTLYSILLTIVNVEMWL